LKIETNKISIVKWVDAQADSGWEEDTKAHLADCTTVGFVVSETKEAVCVASTLSDPHNNCRMHIPKKWITSRRELNIGEDDESSNIQATD
jgi:hypothetical protein